MISSFYRLVFAKKANWRWPVVGSPLTAAVAGPAGTGPAPRAATLPKRAALAELPAAYSRERMAATVRALSTEEMEGRGYGSPGLERAAELLAARFAAAGLAPGGDSPGSFLQAFDATAGSPPRSARLRNVIGYLPGTDPRYEGESVVVRWTASGTHKGPHLGFPPTLKLVGFRGMTWLRFSEGRIIETWDSWNQGRVFNELQSAWKG